MLVRAVTDSMSQQFAGIPSPILPWNSPSFDSSDESDNDGDDDNDTEPVSGARAKTQIWLAARHREFSYV